MYILGDVVARWRRNVLKRVAYSEAPVYVGIPPRQKTIAVAFIACRYRHPLGTRPTRPTTPPMRSPQSQRARQSADPGICGFSDPIACCAAMLSTLPISPY